MSIPETSTDPITPRSPHKSNCKTHLVCIINRVYFSLVVACCIFIWKITKHYWYPCYRHNQVSKSHSFFDILLVLSLWAPKTIVFRSLWSWQWNNVKPLAVWQYNDAMSFYRHMKWECLSFHILEHFKYIFPCLVKTFDKFYAELGEWKNRCLDMKSKPVWYAKHSYNHLIKWRTMEMSPLLQIFIKPLSFFILRRLYNWHKTTLLYIN